MKLPALVEPEEGDEVVSYSELSTYRQCPLKHLLAYRHRYQKPNPVGGALDKGTQWHELLEAHYLVLQDFQVREGRQQRPDEEEALLQKCAEAVNPYLFDDRGEQTEVQELLSWMYAGHVEAYGSDPRWQILAVEGKLQDRLLDDRGRKSRFVLKAKLDLVVLEVRTGVVWVVDHKSGGELPKEKSLELDDQFGLYVWLLRQGGLVVGGAIHSAARTKLNAGDKPENFGNSRYKPQTLSQRFLRTYLSRGEEELTNVARDAWAVAYTAYDLGGPVYSSPNPKDCQFLCDFKEAHLMARKGVDLEYALEVQGFKVNLTRH